MEALIPADLVPAGVAVGGVLDGDGAGAGGLLGSSGVLGEDGLDM